MNVSQNRKQEISSQQEESYQTRRVTVPALEEILFDALPLLDHGFVRVIDYMGTDESIVQAARVSYGKGTKQVNQDKGLIYYLMRHWHSTPFEMCEIKFHIKLPIFVARQWIRHRTANVNEYSARYSILSKEFYIPKPEHLAAQSNVNNQGRGDTLNEQEAAEVLELLKNDAEQCYSHYQEMLNLDEAGNPRDESKSGLARELARMNLNLNYYTEWYWKIDLHNLMHFLRLRADSHAQYEIRVYAELMTEILEKWCPITAGAYKEYREGATALSKTGTEAVKRMLAGEKVTQETSGLTKREWGELCASLNIASES
ncbi:MAG: thymidylate synthase (FAD) [Alphaproteobacteria bacterium CG11_big_fil_rev_8_21_14_0_20_44_7]|nr:MAG: thymidylate synthase (FAD) [Alphaproteobacteria bacterium CG11_big_fil_rev_8_21_14_0_20_44_7]